MINSFKILNYLYKPFYKTFEALHNEKSFYLLICILFFNSCYVYKPIEGKEETTNVFSVKQQMQPGRIYKIDVDQKTYVVKVVGWEKKILSLRKPILRKILNKTLQRTK